MTARRCGRVVHRGRIRLPRSPSRARHGHWGHIGASGTHGAVRRRPHPSVVARVHGSQGLAPWRVHPRIHGVHRRRPLPPCELPSITLPRRVYAVGHHGLTRDTTRGVEVDLLWHPHAWPWSPRVAWRHEGGKKSTWWHWPTWHSLIRRHLTQRAWCRGIVCDAVDGITRVDKAIVMEGFGFAGVLTRVSPLRRRTVQVPEHAPPGVQEPRWLS